MDNQNEIGLTQIEIESIQNTITGMTDKQKRVVAYTLPIEMLVDRIRNELITNNEKLDVIAKIINS